jgi:hypothetical protein
MFLESQIQPLEKCYRFDLMIFYYFCNINQKEKSMTQHPQLEMQFSRWLPDVYGWCLPDIKPKWWQQLRALNPLVLPVYSGRVSAGFPSPADDYAIPKQ